MPAVTLFGKYKTFEQVQPRGVRRFVDIKVEIDTQKKFLLHPVDFDQVDAGYLRPRFIRVSVIVKELVGHHETCNGYAKLASRLRRSEPVTFFETVYVMQRQDDNGLRDLCSLQEFLHKLDKSWSGHELEGGGGRDRMIQI